MQLNIDGHPSQHPDAVQFFGAEAERMGVTVMALQDTRRGPYSGRALTRHIDVGRRREQRHNKRTETKWAWRHETKLAEINVGGVTTGMSQRLNRWVGHDKASKPAVIEDCRNAGRYQAIKLLGRRRDGCQRTMLIVNVYVPQAQGEWARTIAKRPQCYGTR